MSKQLQKYNLSKYKKKIQHREKHQLIKGIAQRVSRTWRAVEKI